jgi:hemoglobin-like flavoprotein
MNATQIDLVKTTWQQVMPIRAAAADLFYGRLFELAPDTRPLFKRDIHAQGAMLMSTLDTVVRSLHDLGAVLPTAQQLARRHVGYGVQPRHYDSVGMALIWTLEQGLGTALTPAARHAWLLAYSTLAEAMKAAAYPSSSAAREAESPAVLAPLRVPAQGQW